MKFIIKKWVSIDKVAILNQSSSQAANVRKHKSKYYGLQKV